MKKLYTLIAIYFFIKSAYAQIPTGGTDLISTPLTSNGIWDPQYGAKTVVNVSGQPFTQALQVETIKQPSNSWEFQLDFSPILGGINTNDVVLFTFYARTIASIQETGEGFANVIVEKNSGDYSKVLSNVVSIGSEWKQYFIKGQSTQTLSASQIHISFQLAYPKQTLQFAEIRVINYGTEYTLSELPETKITYQGSEPNASWRAEADQRIEQYRKGDIKLNIVDKNGNPIPNAGVTLEMEKHHFGFGSAVDGSMIPTNTAYRDTILELFNQVVLENDLKWPTWMWPNHKEIADNAVNFFNSKNIPVRGHALVWPSFRFSPEFLLNYKNDPVRLKQEVDKHIDEITTRYSGKLLDWDVMNEPYDNHEYMDILGYPEMAQWFKRTREKDPTVKLFINDYSILSGGGLDVPHQNDYFNKIKYIDSLGGGIQGIGMQGHFSAQLTAPTKVYQILDRFATLKKDIKVTEFDINIKDEQVQADYTRDFMTILFSHPSVTAFVMWGFWEGRHWKPEGAMYRNDWSIKPNGLAYKDLVFNKWWTPKQNGISNNSGSYTTRGFLGEYIYNISYGNKKATANINVNKTGVNEFTVKLDTLVNTTNTLSEAISFAKCYPQPFANTFTLEVTIDGPYDVFIINAEGKVVEKHLQETKRKIELGQNLLKGIYVCHIKAENGYQVYKINKNF